MGEEKDTTEAITALLPGALGSTIANAFRRMEIAEEEIEAAKNADPEHADRIHEAFRHLVPSEPLQEKGDELYRAHCRELIGRVARGGGERKLRLGTAAEVVATLSDLSQHAPLERTAFVLYGELFQKLLPEKAREIEPLRGPRDQWEAEQAQELEGRLREKLAIDRAA